MWMRLLGLRFLYAFAWVMLVLLVGMPLLAVLFYLLFWGVPFLLLLLGWMP